MTKSQPSTIPFTKMHGAGNDYVYIDCFNNPPPPNPEVLAIAIADRHTGVGGDGLILICPPENKSGARHADARMRMFNADGSESEMCGNGIRCVAKYMFDHRLCRSDHLLIETGAGILALELFHENGRVYDVRVDMGPPRLVARDVPTRLGTAPTEPVINFPLEIEDQTFEVTCVSMGNPHCVIFVEKATDAIVFHFGPLIENHTAFPERVNVEFVEVISANEVKQRTWERGSGETLACGTGASAVCVAGVLTGRTDRTITNHLLGGTLTLEWPETTNHVFMTGPAIEVFAGNWPTNMGN